MHRNRRPARAARRPTILGVLALLVVLLTVSCGADAPESAATTTAEPGGPKTTDLACSPPTAEASPGGQRTLTVDGTERSYQLTLPDGIEQRAMVPLIVTLHGFGGSAAEFDDHTQLAGRGAARGAIVVTPDALGAPARWNFDRRPSGPDDYAFIDALLVDLAHRFCIDPDRTFVAGSSNGAAFAGLLACTEPYRFAAVAMVIATVPSGCPDTVEPAVMIIRGTADAHVPYDGTPEMIAGYADRYGCDQPPVTEVPADGVERTRYTGCRRGSEVVLDAVVGGTHSWPGSTETSTADTVTAGAYQATDEILDFFERHRRAR
jgi:polyhydroxybutyrate depolymerase